MHVGGLAQGGGAQDAVHGGDGVRRGAGGAGLARAHVAIDAEQFCPDFVGRGGVDAHGEADGGADGLDGLRVGGVGHRDGERAVHDTKREGEAAQRDGFRDLEGPRRVDAHGGEREGGVSHGRGPPCAGRPPRFARPRGGRAVCAAPRARG